MSDQHVSQAQFATGERFGAQASARIEGLIEPAAAKEARGARAGIGTLDPAQARRISALFLARGDTNKDGRVSRTRSRQVLLEEAVLPAQIEALADLDGYLKLASRPEWRRVRLPLYVSSAS